MKDETAHESNEIARLEARTKFVETLGMIAQAEGLPRIAGRLLGLLIFEGTAYSFSALAEELQVSRGSISSSARLLQQLTLIKRVGKPGERQDYFQLADRPYEALVSTEITRIRYAKSEIAESISAVPADEAGVRDRLCAFHDLFDAIEVGFTDVLTKISNEETLSRPKRSMPETEQ